MSRELKDRIVTLRKARPCGWCGRLMATGTKARNMVGFCEGHFMAEYYCQKCDRELHAGTCYEKVGAGGWEMI